MIVGTISLALVSAAAPKVPAGDWVLDYAEAQCSARGQFGTAEKPLFLILKPSPTRDLVQLNIVKKRSGSSGAHEYAARIGLGQAKRVELGQLSFSGSNNFEVRQVNLPAELAAQLASADRLSWSAPGINITFETGDLGPVARWLSSCREKMRAHWNIGEANERALRTPAKPITPLMSLFSTQDYPGQSLRQDASGVASVIVLIDERGRPRGCMLDTTSGAASLDAMTCAVIRERGKFEPAIGANGKPVRSYIAQRVHWYAR
jgi:hypothetical protein